MSDVDDLDEEEVLLSDHLVPAQDLIREDEDALEEREKVIATILEMAPDLGQDPDFVRSLRGEPGAYVILAVPAEREGLAPLIARAYQLSQHARERGSGTSGPTRQ